MNVKGDIGRIQYRAIKLFARFGIAAGFLSAVADRFGMWPQSASIAWGSWRAFVEYTDVLTPFFPAALNSPFAIIATIGEILFAVCLIIGFKTEFFAMLSGFLLLIFALSMSTSTGIKTAFDASVFAASGGAFALSLLKEKYLELDCLLSKCELLHKNK